MDYKSKVIFKELMEYVKEFEQLGTRWCEDTDVNAVARARSYGKKIMNAMKPFIETSITESTTLIEIAAAAPVEVATPAEVIVEPTQEVIEPVVEAVVEAPKVEEIEATVEVTPAVEEPVEEVKESKEVKPTKDSKSYKGYPFNKKK